MRRAAVDILGRTGIDMIAPIAGNRFEPPQHRAIEALDTSDAAKHETVAALIRPGYRDQGRVKQWLEVQVYVKR
jgi:molecular chaperone GrpE (heat shock protein)